MGSYTRRTGHRYIEPFVPPSLDFYLRSQADYYRVIGTDESRFLVKILEDTAAAVEAVGAKTPFEFEQRKAVAK